jgi:hypothetical protein
MPKEKQKTTLGKGIEPTL